MGDARQASYLGYWMAWLVLLAVTLVMVGITHPALQILGISVKAAVILLWFMHLKQESLGLALTVIVSILFTGLVLFALIIPDGLAM